MGLKTWSRAFAVYKRLPFRFKDTNTLKVKEWGKILHANNNQKEAAHRGVQPSGVSGPPWKKDSCVGPHIQYIVTHNHKKIS